MSEAKFMKGKWSVGGSAMSMGENYRGQFTITSSNFHGDISNVTDANISLIEAAPEMYEMLESLREDYGLLTDVGKDIDMLLAKARGEL